MEFIGIPLIPIGIHWNSKHIANPNISKYARIFSSVIQRPLVALQGGATRRRYKEALGSDSGPLRTGASEYNANEV